MARASLSPPMIQNMSKPRRASSERTRAVGAAADEPALVLVWACGNRAGGFGRDFGHAVLYGESQFWPMANVMSF